jgi:uncharacterized repeat protein (TIGR03806 family)
MPFLLMPRNEGGALPQVLSKTGAFRDARALAPVDSLIPYELNVSFWSDGASKWRWLSVPNQKGEPAEKIRFSPTGEWVFPNGTVFVKHFEIATNEMHLDQRRRLETRLLVRDCTGGVYGVTYKWRPDLSDADLLKDSLAEQIAIKSASGFRTQTWYYPSPADCRTCHTTNAGGVLGVKTRQLNRDCSYAVSGASDNQLRAWNHAGLFEPKIKEEEIASFSKLAHLDNTSAGLEDRVRSYLDANCAQCHRPGGVVSYFDARYDTPLAKQSLIDAPVYIDQGIDGARAIAPNDTWRSIILMRVNTLEPIKMPPLAHETMDEAAVSLLRDWIHSLPGPQVLDPPAILPKGGDFGKTVKVTLTHSDPAAELRYTLDGGVPGKSAPLYHGPVELTWPATVRARAYRPGFTRSITVQETFIVGE